MDSAPQENTAESIGGILDLKDVLERYKDTQFHEGIAELVQSNTKIRRVSRDGNCFYVSIICLALEQALKSEESLQALKAALAAQNQQLQAAGMEEFIIQEFAEPIFLVLSLAGTEKAVGLESLDSLFWQSTTVYFRMITSGYVQTHPDEFSAFLEEEVGEYCAKQIEANHSYAGEIEQTAISRALDVSFEIIWLERGSKTVHTKGTGRKLGTLLYMPEHFDIIYPAME